MCCFMNTHIHIHTCNLILHTMIVHWSVGEGGKSRDHRTSFHAILKIVRSEGVFGMYNGLVYMCCG